MITLTQYILEELITSKNLLSKIKFVESDKDENHKILHSSDYGLKGMRSNDVPEYDELDDFNELMFYDESTHYKIMYEDNVLGVFALYDMKNFYDDYANSFEDPHWNIFTGAIMQLLIFNSLKTRKNAAYNISKYKSSNVIEHAYFLDEQELSKELCRVHHRNSILEFLNDIYSHTIYVTYLYMNKNIRNKLDISNTSVLLSIYKLLLDKLKNENYDCVFAVGKNVKTHDLYIKCLKFNGLDENDIDSHNFCNRTKGQLRSFPPLKRLLKTFVYKAI